jgi:hypothetical protein
MRKILTALTLAISIAAVSAPKKSEAGILIGWAAGDVGAGASIGGGLGVAILGVGFVMQDGQPFADPVTAMLFFGLFGGAAVGVTLLDVDGNMPIDSLAQNLKKIFPEIDNPESLTELAIATNEAWKERTKALPEAQNVTVSLSAEKLKQVLSSSDLSEANFNKIVRAYQ